MSINEGKVCNSCGEYKLWNEYGKDKTTKNGYKHVCKTCRSIKRKTYNEKRPTSEQAKTARLKWKYGITPEDYDNMMISQHSKCYICSKSDSELVIDHCHTNGHIRALLCGNCNKGLGFFKDNTINLNNAIEYLIKFNK